MNFWIFVYIAGAVQAALLAMTLWRRPANRPANRLLAVWLGLTGLDLAVKAVYWHLLSSEWFRAYRFVALFPFLYGSLFYLYVRAMVEGQGFRARDVVHLAGFIVMLVLNGYVFVATDAQVQALSQRWIAGERAIGAWFDVPLFLYSLSYVVAALWLMRGYRHRLRERRSDADRLSLRWIDAMGGFQIAIWSVAIVQAVTYLPVFNYGLLFGLVAAWVCMVGWFSLEQPPVPAEPLMRSAREEAETDTTADTTRYKDVEARLTQLMSGDMALYREPALTIGRVAKSSGYPEYLVSTVINRRLGGSFCDYINRLRVEAVRERLADAAEPRTILDLAYACGFTSKSTFNAAFKRHVGDTPSNYRRYHASAGPID
ncbi:AraC family transcriptional regulator [Dyella monticola]|uniref:AraC family transcriptional regulator n=1 Tax=Dyella monticola TaxID=1927958 RepID=A0A370WU26_9GAMM|nr:helix-turn-helix transcriptional regulator [Dyella monticola]RDS79659.1 AraC family transcriptional regulator [Dyella monticola]